MSEEKKYRNYTAEDIEKYHKGLLTPGEMHQLEKAALDDPFLADALEGYGTTSVNITADLSELEKKLQERTTGTKVISMVAPRNSFKWWKVAAAVSIIGGLGFITFQLSTNKRNKPVAELEKEKKSNEQAVIPPVRSDNYIMPETTRVANTNKPVKTTTLTTEKKLSTKSFDGYALADSGKNSFVATITSPVTSAQPNNQGQRQINDSIKISEDKDVGRETAMFRKTTEKAKTSLPQPLTKNNDGIANNNYKKAEANRIGISENFKLKELTVSSRGGITPTNYFRGRVVDANNNPLPFANITNSRDNVGTYADARGNFTLISPDSVLDVQVHSVGFANNFTQLRNNVATNQVILEEDKTLPAKIISNQKPDTNRSRTANIKFEEPEPADGWSNYDIYLANNINVPDDLKNKQSNGRQVQVSFEVNQNGDPIDIKVEKSLCQKCDEEAIRLIKEGPKWKKKNKKAKRVTVSVPFGTDHPN